MGVKIMFLRDETKEKIGVDSGQSLFEFLLFTPFFILLLSTMITISGAINGAINQQKITRAYFFHLIKGNSAVPPLEDLDGAPSHKTFGHSFVGTFAIGWMEKNQGGNDNKPFATCYKMHDIATVGLTNDNCDVEDNGPSSKFFRIFTVFGVCATSYQAQGNGFFQYSHTNLGSGSCGVQ